MVFESCSKLAINNSFTLVEPFRLVEQATAFIEHSDQVNYARGIPDPLALEIIETPGKAVGLAGCFQVPGRIGLYELAYGLDSKINLCNFTFARPFERDCYPLRMIIHFLRGYFVSFPENRIQILLAGQVIR